MTLQRLSQVCPLCFGSLAKADLDLPHGEGRVHCCGEKHERELPRPTLAPVFSYLQCSPPPPQQVLKEQSYADRGDYRVERSPTTGGTV